MVRKLASLFILLNILITPAFAQTTQNMNVTATVPPLVSPTNAQVLISSSPLSSTVLQENDEVTITIRYRSQETASWPFEVVGSWQPGQIENNPSNTIDVFSYIIGSATNADEGTTPVVDLINRKITWTIPSVSSSTTYHTVSFKLKVRNDIPTEKAISAVVQADGKIFTTPLPQQTLTFTIQKTVEPTLSTGPTPTSIPPTSAPGIAKPTAITTPPSLISPSPKPPDFRFGLVEIKKITDTETEIYFQTSIKSTYIISYGTSPKKLTQQASSLTFEKDHTITLSDLQPDTSYFFSIKALDEAGDSIISDIFTFRTAKGPQEVIIEKSDIAILWKNFFLTSADVNRVVIPHNTPFTISANVKNPGNIRSIKARFKNTAVLGINNTTQSPNVDETPLTEILPGIFSGEITTPLTNGKYQILLETVEESGTFETQIVPYDFYISDPLRVIDNKTGKAIEHASVEIKRFEESLHRYTPLQNSFALDTLTDEKGQLAVVLPAGRYIIEVKHTLYKPTSLTTELGISDLTLPAIYLESNSTFSTIVTQLKESVANVVHYCASAISPLFSSVQTQPFIITLLVILLVVLTIATLWEKDTKVHIETAHKRFYSYLVVLLLLSLLNVLVLICLGISLILLRSQGAVMVFVLSFVTTILWLIFLRIFWRTHQA